MMPSGTGSPVRTLLSLALALSAGAGTLWAQPASPPPPEKYQVQIRYQTSMTRNARLAQFFALTRYLESIGFNKDAGPDTEALDPEQTRMSGTIASANVRKILVEPHVRSILLMPAGYTVPTEGDKTVKIQMELVAKLVPQRRRELAEQVRSLLEPLGFREAVGYDHRGHTRLVGTLTATEVSRLLEDLRWHSSGWLTPATPVGALPTPLRNVWPLELIEIIPEPADVPAAKEPPEQVAVPQDEQYLLKIARGLRELPTQDKPVRMEVFLARAPGEAEGMWRRDLLLAASESVIEGRQGAIVTLAARPDQAPALAKLPNVVTIRLPRPASVGSFLSPGSEVSRESILRLAGLDRLHAQNHRGQKVRVAIIDTDFRGYQQFVGKQLLSKTRHFDLTAETDSEVLPKPFAHDSAVGHGTQCALALALAAPQADLTLIRIDTGAPYQLETVARYVNGQPVVTESLRLRNQELSRERNRLELAREQLLEERKTALENFGIDPKSVEQREAYFKKQADFETEETRQRQREERYLRLVRDLQALKGIQIVSCSLVWNDDYPVDGSSPLSRYFDEGLSRLPRWFQSSSDVRGQVWAGRFQDADGNGVMEFAPPGTPLKPGRWTSELNFFGWQPSAGRAVADLPKGNVRVSMQWREPHDPVLWGQKDDPYRQPLADLRLLVLRQRDPSGTKLPADDMEAIARSVDLPLRLDNQPSSAAYQQTVEFSIEEPGRYALRVEGKITPSIWPASIPTVPATERPWELHSRIYVSALDETTPSAGRPIFLDYATDLGTVGMPADAHQVMTVGAADEAGQPRSYVSGGPVMSQELHLKPNLLVLDNLPLAVADSKSAGSAIAAAFAAGKAACELNAGTIPSVP